MKVGTLLTPSDVIPERLREGIQAHYPDCSFNQLTVRYYANVEDVGYEYFMNQVVPNCHNRAAVHYLAPFISFVRLGETLVLDQNNVVIYDMDDGDSCTETGPFWLVTSKEELTH